MDEGEEKEEREQKSKRKNEMIFDLTFCDAGDQTHDYVHARQSLCH
jgi:hypothetical protein